MFSTLNFVSRTATLKIRSWARRGQLEALQRRRFRRMLRFAVRHSPFYRTRLEGLDLDGCRPEDLPVLTKADMMAHFDDIVTDRRISRQGIERFMAEPEHLGRLYLGRYAVNHTSGSEGQPALIVQEQRDMLLPFALQASRGHHCARRAGDLVRRLWRPSRLAVVTQRPGFYPSGAMFGYMAAARLPSVHLLRLSVFEPLPELVERLNEFRPNFLIGYTSILEMLAREETAGRLRLRQTGCLEQLTNISEPLPAVSRTAIEAAFGVTISDHYALGECSALTSGCPFHPGSHVNIDLAYLEVVDAMNRPVPPGKPGSKILVTNLYNRIQPFLRYQVDDVVTVSPTPCPCGSPFPLIQSVAGRTKERFWLLSDGGYRELPYYVFLAALHYCLEIADHQVLQTGPNRFVVRVAPLPGKSVDPLRIRQLVESSLKDEDLFDRVVLDVEVVPELARDPHTGKRQRVKNLFGTPVNSLVEKSQPCVASPA